jgi:hypothetical protein
MQNHLSKLLVGQEEIGIVENVAEDFQTVAGGFQIAAWGYYAKGLGTKTGSVVSDGAALALASAWLGAADVLGATVAAALEGAVDAPGGEQAAEPRPRPVTRLPAGRASPASECPAGPAWAELHCHSSYSFLDGASAPAELVAEAARLGLAALAITDHDGMYGVPQFVQAAARLKEQAGTGIGTVFGAELSLDLPDGQNGVPDPAGRHLLVLARDPDGYRRLCRVVSAAQVAGKEKGRPVYDLAELAAAHDGHWVVLTGCRKGAVPAALANRGRKRDAARLFAKGYAQTCSAGLTMHGKNTSSLWITCVAASVWCRMPRWTQRRNTSVRA